MKKITTFWNWFQKNEQEIINSFYLGIDSNAIFSQFGKKLDYVSKRISFIIKIPKTSQEKYLIIFTGFGYRKLFPKLLPWKNRLHH